MPAGAGISPPDAGQNAGRNPGQGGGLGAVPGAAPAAYSPGDVQHPRQVELPPGQLEDLNAIRNEWGKIIREVGGSVRSSFRNTVVEPDGESCLCVVFTSPEAYAIGNRPTALGEIERHVEAAFGKKIYFKARLAGAGERFDTIYVSKKELEEKIHMDIQEEDF